MVLSDGEIREAISGGLLRFTPPIDPLNVSTSSIGLRLGHTITVYKVAPDDPAFSTVVDLERLMDVEAGIAKYSDIKTLATGDSFTLKPRQFILAYTMETVRLSSELAARVEGRSSFGRLGISIHQTAPTIHAGFEGQIRLEILNNGPFRCLLRPGLEICQLIVERLGRPATEPLQSQFQHQEE